MPDNNRAFQFTPKAAAMAQRLLAHARLCEQVARACWNEVTAEKLKRMAQDCTRAAAEVAPGHEAPPDTRH